MKKIDIDNTLCIYDEGELVAMYEVKKTKSDIAKALADYGYFDDIDEDDWEIGIGENCNCHSLEDVAVKIIEDNEFFDEDGEVFFGINRHSPSM